MSRIWTPHSYQQQALDFLATRERANLFARMGSGKTAIILTWLLGAQVWSGALPVLILGPLRVARSVWSDEINQWAHLSGLRVSKVVGTANERLAAIGTPADIYTMNYDNLAWLIELLEQHWPFKTVIADESTRLKGFRLKQGTKRAGALARIAHHKTQRWVNLSGLPAPNGLVDLWGQQWFVDGGKSLGMSFSAFEARWFYRPPRGAAGDRKTLPHRHSQGEIEGLLKPTTLAIDPRSELGVDEPIESTVWVDLPPAAMRQYTQMKNQFFTELQGGMVNAPTAAVKSNKLLQMANGAAYHEDSSWSWVHDEKIEALKSIVEEAAGMPVLLAYTFRSDLERLKAAFPKLRVLDASDRHVERDWNAGHIPLLAAHPKSAGHGLNLQYGGNILVYFGQDWNLEDFDQILERIGPTRQKQAGLNRAVYVYHIMARGTLDATVKARRASKISVVDALMDAMKGVDHAT